jgi:hypothetical protein
MSRAHTRRSGGRVPDVLAAAVLLAAAGPAAAAPAEPPPMSGAALIEHVRVLAADSLEGRRTGTRGCDAAADQIARRLAAAGLEPGGDSDEGGASGSDCEPPDPMHVERAWRQSYAAVLGESLGAKNALALRRIGERPSRGEAPAARPADSIALDVRADWTPFGFSESGSLEDAEIAFVGYGITAPERQYDDYAGVDARGKAVLVLRYEPGNRDSTSAFDGTRLTSYADFRWKAWNAQNHGAVGVLFAIGPLDRTADSAAADELFPLARDAGHAAGGRATIPVVQIASAWAESLLAWDGASLRAMQAAIDTAGRPLSQLLGATRIGALAVDVVRDRRSVANVVGVLPGAGARAGEAIVVGAHYDHLGMGGEGSLAPDSVAVHNGADDNASGTAALIEVARAIAADPPPERRMLVFAAFSGEEEGLLGSSAYTKNPPVPIERTAAMINLDMVGRSTDGKLHVGGVGTSPEFRALVAEEAEPLGFRVDFSDGGFGPSDHTSFYAKGVPVLFFFTGAHADYHKPSDDVEKIEVAGLEAVTRLVERVARRLAAAPSEIAFVRVAADTAGRGASEGYETTRGYGPYLGTIPDFGESEGGVLLSGVRAASPAEKAGIQGGDVVVRFGGLPIANLHDYTYALRARKPGDAVVIEVRRGDAVLALTATLETRK